MSSAKNKYSNELLIAKTQDAILLAQQRKNAVYTSFLYEEEQALITSVLKKQKAEYMFFGGYSNAQRKILGIFPKEKVVNNKNFPIIALEFIYKAEYNLKHRDFLGSLMSTGIKREIIGDIITENGKSIVFVKKEMQEYIKTQIIKIGNVAVNIKNADLKNLPKPSDLKSKTHTVSSLRLDNILSTITGESREKSVKTIKFGLVSVNHLQQTQVSFNVKENDVVTIKGKGKFIIGENLGLSKKGKIKIIIKNYI